MSNNGVLNMFVTAPSKEEAVEKADVHLLSHRIMIISKLSDEMWRIIMVPK